jgi:hypothetical protein
MGQFFGYGANAHGFVLSLGSCFISTLAEEPESLSEQVRRDSFVLWVSAL